jgi:hypothetical protein
MDHPNPNDPSVNRGLFQHTDGGYINRPPCVLHEGKSLGCMIDYGMAYG